MLQNNSGKFEFHRLDRAHGGQARLLWAKETGTSPLCKNSAFEKRPQDRMKVQTLVLATMYLGQNVAKKRARIRSISYVHQL